MTQVAKEMIRHQGMQYGGNRIVADDAIYFEDRAFVVDAASGLVVKGPLPYADPRAFGARFDGINDDTAGIQAAIDAVALVGGGEVRMPPGIGKVTGTIYIRTSSTALVGAGFSTNPGSSLYAQFEPATELKWSGAAKGTMIFIGPGPINGIRIENIGLNGNSIASRGIHCDTVQFSSFRNIGMTAGAPWGRSPLGVNTSNPVVTNPTVTPTVSILPDSVDGNLAPGVYSVRYSWVTHPNEFETLASVQSADFTVLAGEIPLITVPSLPAGATSWHLYITRAGEKEHGLYTIGNTGLVAMPTEAYQPATGLEFECLTDIGAPGTPDYVDCIGNHVEHVQIGIWPTCIRLNGSPDPTLADTDQSVFTRIHCLFTGNGIDFANCDTNWLFGLFIVRRPNHIGHGARFRTNGRQNMIFGASLGGTYCEAPPGVAPLWSNFILGFGNSNAEPAPEIEATARLSWHEIGTASTGWHMNDSPFTVQSTIATDIPTIQARNDGTGGVARAIVRGEAGANVVQEIRIQAGGGATAMGTVSDDALVLTANAINRVRISTAKPLEVLNDAGASVLEVAPTGLLALKGPVRTTVGAAGGASALPATPRGYLRFTIADGTEMQIPYYDIP